MERRYYNSVWGQTFFLASILLLGGTSVFAQPLPPLPSFSQTDSETSRTTTRTSLQPPVFGPDEPKATVAPSQPLPFPDQPPGDVRLDVGASVTMPESSRQTIRFGPRYGKLNDYSITDVGPNTKRLTYSGGLKVSVVTLPSRAGESTQEVELAADDVVIWIQNAKLGTDLFSGLEIDRNEKPAEGDKEPPKKMLIELYLSGNVVIRRMGEVTSQGPSVQTIRAEEIYYDLDQSRLVAMKADVETRFENGTDPIHLQGREVWRLGPRELRAFDARVFSSKRPADPSLTFDAEEATLVERYVIKRNVFGVPFRSRRTGETDISYEQILTGYKNRIRIKNVPVFATPKFKTDLTDPSGPLNALAIRNDRIYGTQLYTTWDMFKLFALRPLPNRRWTFNLDYLSERGVGVGTDFTYRNLLFGEQYRNTGNINLYFLSDRGEDLLGGFRGTEPINPDIRGRAIWSHNQDIYENGTTYTRFMGQFAYLSDKNFYEQYYKIRFDLDPNQETFAYLYGAVDNFGWSALGQVNVNRPWVTETEWLPRLDGALIGESFFERFIYSGRASAGYAQVKPASQQPFSKVATEQAIDTLRLDVNNRLGVPLDVGAFRIEPYGKADLSFYSEDLSGESLGRAYGGGGARASIPFSKIYREANSELLNVRGLNHKVEFGANYFAGFTNVNRDQLPVLDRLNDDSMDLTYRGWRQLAFGFIPGPDGLALSNSPLFDTQNFATRRMLENRPETLDEIQVVQMDIRQRLQTKRGRPGADHTTDWMSLDLSASYFPDAERDNFGQSFSFFEYLYQWNIGDRTTIGSSGWYDPFDTGARYFNFGTWFNRPDGSNFYVGYRHIDPLGSRVFIASVGYQLSQKYSISLMNVFDFGEFQSQGTQVTFNRTGTDLTMSIGFTYSALVNNFGIQFLLLPNAALPPQTGRPISAVLGGRR